MFSEILGLDGVLVVVVVAVVLFGSSQIPKLARALGSARREFDDGLRDGKGPPEPAAPARHDAESR
jgi:sec-independent protein translocase protein TatA